jgi:signal transduction histidine kinase
MIHQQEELLRKKNTELEKKLAAKTRELEIQASFEKIREATSGMQRSEDLKDANLVVLEEMQKRGISSVVCFIVIMNEADGSLEFNVANSQTQMISLFKGKINDNSVNQKMYDNWKSKSNSFAIDMHSAELSNYRDYLKQLGVQMHSDSPANQRAFSMANFSNGIMGVASDEPLSSETISLLERFANVFDSTYTRFLDLQKAEAQTREAEIELALERVRAKTMGMHSSEDLLAVIKVLSEQFEQLGFEVDVANFNTDYYEKDWHLWLLVMRHVYPEKIVVPYFDHPYFKRVRECLDKGLDFNSSVFTKEEKDSFQQHFYSHVKVEITEEHKQFVFSTKGFAWSVVYLKNTALTIANYDAEPYTEEQNAILRRFGNVFEQTYTRFLDLKKAESQARKSQIELALERVRAKTMAMQKPSEFVDVINIIGEQFMDLGFDFDWVNFSANGLDVSKAIDIYNFHVIPGLYQGATRVVIPFFEHPVFKKAEESVNEYHTSGNSFTVVLLVKKDKDTWLDHLFTNTIYKDLPDEAKTSQYNREVYQTSSVVLKDTWLSIGKYDAKPLTDEQVAILKRLANAFGQAYTRFLDLQKAEAQAREAQIQLALERVRARTMAMQKSNELSETSALLFAQIKDLGIETWTSGFNIWQEDETACIGYNVTPAGKIGVPIRLPLTENVFFKTIYDAKKRGNDFIVFESEGASLAETYRYMLTLPVVKDVMQGIIDAGFELPKYQITHCVFFPQGHLMFITLKPQPEAWDIFKRFGKVFEQTYTRFLDLQKAEAQARESQIQLALERVRARTMAMQKSEELSETVFVLFQQFKQLGENPDQATIGIINEDENVIEYWVTMYGNQMNRVFKFSMDEPHVTNKIYKAWREQKKSLVIDLSGDALTEFMAYRAGKGGAAINPDEKRRIINVAFFSKGLLNVQSNEERSQESIKLLERFASVFEQTYTRFLDLKKAEAQAREALIEAGLERVRSRAMAMQSSEELAPLIGTVFTELTRLDLALTRCVIWIFNAETNGATWWMANSEDAQNPISCDLPYNAYEPYLAFLEQWEKRANKFQYELSGTIKKDWDDYLFSKTGLSRLPAVVIDGMKAPERVFLTASFNNFGAMNAATLAPLSDQDLDILLRFAKVFDLTYTRFNDLKQAEAQAREAGIQLALERVRAKAMAMHSSEDVTSATVIMFTELEKLGIENFRCGINYIKTDRTQEVWSVTNSGEEKTMIAAGVFKIDDHPFWKLMYDAWLVKEEFLYYYLTGKEKEDYVKILNGTPNYFSHPVMQFPDIHYQVYFFGEGTVWTMSLQPHSEEDKKIMKRFASVFSLTFSRYRDLLKAEASAREAQIEAALERVRGKAMAIHNSSDVSAAASMVFTELRKLGINPIRCGVGLLNKDTVKAQLYSATLSADVDSLSLVGWVELEKHPVLEKIYESWVHQKDYFPELYGDQLKSYYQLLLAGLSVPMPDFSDNQKQFGYFISFSIGCLYAWSDNLYNEEQIKILRRFAAIIDLTFRRYLELQKSEAATKEAVKQAALDRIRADIASMRTIGDLDRITPLIWNELTILGVHFIRCGVFIMDNEEKQIHTFLSTPEGKGIAAFHLPYNTPGNIAHVISHWYKKEIYTDHWDEKAFKEFADNLVKQGAMESSKQYLSTMPAGGFNLHFVPFQQGMLYVGNLSPLGEEEINLLQSIADAFSTAYARYEDFNKLEAAKKQVDKTLTELKQAQQQLIQSEKMASLGELTAGIAHEIQNPLNFVNNFSDVNQELLVEMKEELTRGNGQEAMSIANDVIENEQKINHHGKRADAIVKGMLQHSRKSSGQKEATDINALTDEYLRLSYHGLRAKDKNFNATIETHFDESIGKINVIPQDIGRVLLNLFNNAFYAVNERKSSNLISYKPTVFVRTGKCDNKIQITVRDNGNGIPQKIVDKIFQPFFTTKPTGQGTGLGLSLSYDIMKAQGGEIKVESKEGEGSEFIIQLPFV